MPTVYHGYISEYRDCYNQKTLFLSPWVGGGVTDWQLGTYLCHCIQQPWRLPVVLSLILLWMCLHCVYCLYSPGCILRSLTLFLYKFICTGDVMRWYFGSGNFVALHEARLASSLTGAHPLSTVLNEWFSVDVERILHAMKDRIVTVIDSWPNGTNTSFIVYVTRLAVQLWPVRLRLPVTPVYLVCIPQSPCLPPCAI